MAEVPELPELTRISSWPKFSPKLSDNDTNLSLNIPASTSSSSLEDIIFFDRESPKGSDSTAPTTEDTQQSDLTIDNEPIVSTEIDSSLVSGSPFDASLSVIISPTAQDDACDENAEEDGIEDDIDNEGHPVETIGRPNAGDISTEFLRVGSSGGGAIGKTIKKDGSDKNGPVISSIANSSLAKDLTLDGGNAGEEQTGAPQLQESDDLSSLSTSHDGIEMAMSDYSDDSFTYMMRYCRCIEWKSEAAEEGAATAKEAERGGIDTGGDDPEAENKSFTPDLSIYRGGAKKTCRGTSKQPPLFITSLDVLDIMTSPQEEAKKENGDEKKKGKFTSFDVFNILFSSCIGCGCGGGS
mmetsp:Transcript_6768/g.18890  ORF Transcript_6768/g.18890 Transcript_6768/m.18890 type:complete len:354 (-) Transcript_6768:187-1248(-)|eukprot:CAMPEP_0181060094 /NCGR_PEP_ID=MMETSP1070-20121207/21764_1 /TAXON_ID=265543 /ORGANISM="Minutocellus polymorphus, Strain NH13" /LENGTH=353 /DNA_ID=CAMNT_0023139879 /DNA_START=52 /DNA_END=1113 /DNA_ORIENTATION=-